MRTKLLPFFVYGTLRPGQKNYSRFLEGSTVREESGVVSGRLFYVRNGGYPYVLAGGGAVVGEVVFPAPQRYDEILKSLDSLEDYDPMDEAGSLYLRRETEARLETGERIQVWIYFWNDDPDVGEPVTGGDFAGVLR